ncbi:MAG: hypothetical protein V1734_02950 [Nanoarchaeota archaeon]
MTLEDNLDPEPVCVEGIEPELAMQRAYDAGLMPKSDCRTYKLMKCFPPGYFALGGFLLSGFTPVTMAVAALCFGIGVLAELKEVRDYENCAVSELGKKYLIS